MGAAGDVRMPRMNGRGAAFFDFIGTLMSGSSCAEFGRAAYRAGLVSRGQVARSAIDHLRFRLRGASDQDTDALVELVNELLRGVPERTLRRMIPNLLEGILPRIYPQMVAEVRAPGCGTTRVHRQRREQRGGRAVTRC